MARKPEPIIPRDGMTIRITAGTSRGRDTYGYAVVSLRADDRRVATCNGGGYDMAGTVLGAFITDAFPDELRALANAGRFDGDPNRGTRSDYLYGARVYRDGTGDKPARVHLDGGCGFRSMESILEACGWYLNRVHGNRREDVYLLQKGKRVARR